MLAEVREVVAALKLTPLPGEGGFVRQTWRSEAGSAAYYLMTAKEFSALHRLRAREVWHFYAGDAVEHVTLNPRDGVALVARLGANVSAGEQPQLAVPGGAWQGARLASAEAGWALVGCTLTPAWDERDFELGRREALCREFPAAADFIRALTR